MVRGLLQYLKLRRVTRSTIQHSESEGINDAEEPVNFSKTKSPEVQLRREDVINLCIQEYIVLRAEQRTRLDSANKIIHYYAVVIGAVIVGLLSIYKNGGEAAFLTSFHNAMLLIPLITLPFAFTQQNEEIFVRHIGDYLEGMKSQISEAGDDAYWGWEKYHNRPSPCELQLTGVFRAGLLIIFSLISLLLFGVTSHPIEWFHNFGFLSRGFGILVLLTVDCILLIMALWTAFRMAKKRRTRASAEVDLVDGSTAGTPPTAAEA